MDLDMLHENSCFACIDAGRHHIAVRNVKHSITFIPDENRKRSKKSESIQLHWDLISTREFAFDLEGFLDDFQF